ncbi:hypothetical protein WR25_25713 [Diploscapter pachys]|uniref:GGDEF domain-containing protein n=1 Tax=Diploscapter pachys TaxID=2018661 RepID=A0A2A2KHP3_9BILA|nr:hypothetical protein WR25_25713 [Diploscapter pachys]
MAWLLALVVLRVIQVAAFESATPVRQAKPAWRRMFLLGSAFAVPCLLPPIAFLFVYDAGHQRGWGWLGLILLVALMVVAWQVNRLIERGLLRRFQNQALIEHLQCAQRHSEGLNRKLSAEIAQRRQAEDDLRQAHAGLEQRVAERSHELDQANQALSKSEQRLALALQASELGLWDWNLETDEVHHTQLHALFGLDADQGKVLRMLGTRRDITAQKEQEEQQRLAATVFEAASEGIAILDADFQLLAVNQAFCDVTGYGRAELIARNALELPCSRDARRHSQAIDQALDQQGRWQGELVEARKSGELYPQWLQLNSAAQRMRLNGRSLALLHVDLDRFKLLNESLGHELADQLLKKMAQRLANAVPEADTVARLSGDEFAVLFDGYTNLSSLCPSVWAGTRW